MEAAKQAVAGIIGRGGKQETQVDEVVNPAVTSETVKPHRHEETTEAIDREVHQHHYHTTVQPISHQETLPEQHTHNLAPQVEKTVHHGDAEQDRARAMADIGQFRDASTTIGTSQSTAAAPTQVGEHVHHHVHEVVQPIIHKETIQPEVVHTVIPIHEKHIAPSEHHGLSMLPTKTMDEFKQMGAATAPGTHTQREYEGHPKQYNQEFQPRPAPIDRHPSAHIGTHDPVATGHFDDSRRPSGSAGGVLGGASTTGHGTGTGLSTGTGTTASGAGAGDIRGSGVDAFYGTPSNTVGSGLGTGAALGATAAGTALAAEHHHERGLGTSATGTNLTGSNVGSGGMGSGSANPSQRGTHDAALASGATGAGTSLGTSAGHSDRGLGNTLGTSNRMDTTGSNLGHEGTSTGGLPSRVVEPSAIPNASAGSESRDLYDEQAARPPVSGSGTHGTGAGAGVAAAGAGAAATAVGAGAASQSASRTGRKTKHGYTTSADEGPNFGKTKFGFLTGAGGKHGPQDGSTSGRAVGGTAAATGAAAGAAATAHHSTTGTSTDSPAHHSTSGTSTDSPAETHASTRKQEAEPTNMEGGAAKEVSKTASTDDDIQHASQGDDPNLVETKGKWQGTGEPGSHSAVFGLTPDGKKIDDTSSHANQTTKLETTPAEQDKENAAGGGSKGGEVDGGSREGTRPEVAKQMHDPRVAEKGHDGKAEYDSGTGKPGSGA